MVSLAAADRTASYTGRPSPGYRPDRRFQIGELVRLDYVIVYEGYYADFGRTFTVGPPEPSVQGAVTKLRGALDAAIQAARARDPEVLALQDLHRDREREAVGT